jgi:hypothetical protein
MPCPFQRCAGDGVVHCNGTCHGVCPDGQPMNEPADLPELRADLDESLCFECQAKHPCTAGSFCVALEHGSVVQRLALQQLESRL